MDFSLDVPALRKQFPLTGEADERDAELVPRLFDYLDDINANKQIHVSLQSILDRHALREALGVRTGPKWWPPLFAQIVLAADKQLQDQKYQRRSVHPGTREKCVQLRRWVRGHVEAGTLPTNKFGNLSIVDMAKAIGCSDSSSTWKPAFQRHVNRINRHLAKSPDHPLNSPYYVYIDKHKKNWNLSAIGSFDRVLGVKVVQCFKKKYETLALGTATNGHHAVKLFFAYWGDMIATGDQFHTAIGVKIANGETPDLEDIDFVLKGFREHMLEGYDENVCKTHFGHINGLFDVFNREGVLPKPFKLAVPNKNKRDPSNPSLPKGKPKLSIAEVPSKKLSEDDVDKIVRPLLEKRFSKDEVVEATRRNFIKTLASEGITVTGSRQEHIKHIEKLNEERLATLRRCAEDELLEAIETYQRGQDLLAGCDLSYEKDIEPILEEWLANSAKTQGSPMGQARLAPTLFKDVPVDTRIARYLCLCQGRWDGFVPSATKWELNHFHHRALMHKNIPGGRPLIESMMQPHSRAYVAVMVLMLIDTGGNVDSIATIPSDCLSDTNDPNEKIIGWWKPRAKNVYIQDVLEVEDGNRISTVKAVEAMREMTSRLRRMAENGPTGHYRNPAYELNDPPDKQGDAHEYLFITRFQVQEPMYVYDKGTRCKQFKTFLKRHPDLAHIPGLRMEHIRSSVMLDAAIKGEGRLVVGQAIASQKSRDTQSGYVHKYAQQVILEASIRKFQDLLEAVLISDIPNGYKKLGISREEYQEALNEAHRTGLGVMCLNPKAGVQPGTTEGSLCTKLEDCPACKNVYVPAIQENIQDMILFNRYLKEKREELEALSPSDWENVWLPYMVLTDEALARMEKGETAGVFRKALDSVEGAKFACDQLVS